MTDSAMIPWVIVGGGRLGQALAWLARDMGVTVRAIWSRSQISDAPAKNHVRGDLSELSPFLGSAIVWITVTDSAIVEVARGIRDDLKPADVTLHASGSLPSTALKDAGIMGPVGSVHPLLSVHDPRHAVDAFKRCSWTIEGDYAARQFARWFLGRLEVEPYVVDPSDKVLYHASAVASAGLVTALMDVAFELAREAGFDEYQSRDLLLPLAMSTIENLRLSEPGEALTGPIARGDEDVIRQHLEAMEGLPESTRQVYEVLTKRSRELVDD